MISAALTNMTRRLHFSAGMLLLSAAFGTAVSLLILGFDFGRNNNVFHVPYVLDLPAKAVFSGDAFYQTLNNFTSIVWPVMRLFSNEENVATVFLIAHIASRALAFLALSLFFTQLGIRNRNALFIAMCAVAVTPWMQSVSIVGGHGMFQNYFTHSEMTWPFLLGSLMLRQCNRPLAAAALAAITFSINAFVGFWLCVILAACWLFSRPRDTWPVVVRQIVVFAVVAAPVIIWIQFALRIPESVAVFSFIDYIRAYYPDHFLIEVATRRDLICLGLMFASGLMASVYFEQGRFWRIVLVTSASLFVAGSILPYMADDRLVFNLHMLRIDGVIQFMATALITAAAVRNLYLLTGPRQRVPWVLLLFATTFAGDRSDVLLIAGLLFVSVFLRPVQKYLQASAPAAAVAARLPARARLHFDRDELNAILALALWFVWLCTTLASGPSSSYRVAYLVLGWLIGLLLYVSRDGYRSIAVSTFAVALALTLNGLVVQQRTSSRIEGDHAQSADLQQLAAWIRSHPLNATVLLAKEAFFFGGFQLVSRNPVWVDWKQGAAVMWYPPFHDQWSSRYREVMQLNDINQVMQYANRNDIQYFIVRSENRMCPAPARLVNAAAMFVLCTASQTP